MIIFLRLKFANRPCNFACFCKSSLYLFLFQKHPCKLLIVCNSSLPLTPVTKMLSWQTETRVAKCELAKAYLCVKRDDEWLETGTKNKNAKLHRDEIKTCKFCSFLSLCFFFFCHLQPQLKLYHFKH